MRISQSEVGGPALLQRLRLPPLGTPLWSVATLVAVGALSALVVWNHLQVDPPAIGALRALVSVSAAVTWVVTGLICAWYGTSTKVESWTVVRRLLQTVGLDNRRGAKDSSERLRWMGTLMALAGTSYLLTDLSTSQWEPLAAAGLVLFLVNTPLVAHLLLIWPRAGLLRKDLRLVCLAWIAYFVGVAATFFDSTPKACVGEEACRRQNLLPVMPSDMAAGILGGVQTAISFVVCLGLLCRLGQHHRSAEGRRRPGVLILYITAIAVVGSFLSWLLLSQVGGDAADAAVVCRWLSTILFALTPLAIVVSLMFNVWYERAQVSVAEQVAAQPALEIEEALRRALDDPSVSLEFRLPDGLAVDRSGAELPHRSVGKDRVETLFPVSEVGHALVVHDGGHTSALVDDILEPFRSRIEATLDRAARTARAPGRVASLADAPDSERDSILREAFQDDSAGLTVWSAAGHGYFDGENNRVEVAHPPGLVAITLMSEQEPEVVLGHLRHSDRAPATLVDQARRVLVKRLDEARRVLVKRLDEDLLRVLLERERETQAERSEAFWSRVVELLKPLGLVNRKNATRLELVRLIVVEGMTDNTKLAEALGFITKTMSPERRASAKENFERRYVSDVARRLREHYPDGADELAGRGLAAKIRSFLVRQART